MILVDTNVWSELVKATPDPAVLRWERTHAEQLWLATVVVGEFLSGVELMPEGRRKTTLLAQYDRVLDEYSHRIAPFDLPSALRYAEVLAFQERAGRNPGTADAQIAAIALTRGFALATRNLKHFADLGLTLVDPWQA